MLDICKPHRRKRIERESIETFSSEKRALYGRETYLADARLPARPKYLPVIKLPVNAD